MLNSDSRSRSAVGRISREDGEAIVRPRSRPPTFVVFGTRVDQLPTSYERYLLNSMRRELGLGPVPLRINMRAPKNPFDSKPK